VLRLLRANDTLYAQEKADSDNSSRWRILTATDNGTWWHLDVEHIDATGTGVKKNTALVLDFRIRSGQTQETFRDDDSIAKWGYRHQDIGTQCATAEDAALLGSVVLARRREPRWVMPGVIVLRDTSTDAEWVQVAAAEVGHTAMIDVETVPSATPGAITAWTVEGWVETWASEGRRVQFALSEYRLGIPIPWSQADDETWAYWRDNASWLTAMVEV
jgi:hypothetical protein